MIRGAIGNLDVAQIVLYAFFVFFSGLIFYLRREDRREGYPLEDEAAGRLKVPGFLLIPPPKTFRRSDGRLVSAPNFRADTRSINATKTEPWPGAPLEPNGDPMLAGVGPGAYAERADETAKTHDGHDLIVPLRVATNFAVAAERGNPIGFSVVGTDRERGGVVKDLWVDRGEFILRYYEVDTGKRRQNGPPPGDLQRRRLRAPPSDRFGVERLPVLWGSNDAGSRQGDPARRGQDRRLLRRRHTLRHAAARGAPAMKAVNLEKLLPGDIPQGEKILWHGRPSWVSFARRAYRADFVAAYFVALTVWNCSSVGGESGWVAAGVAGAKTLGIGAAALTLARFARLRLRTNDALCCDHPPPGPKSRRCAADLHQPAVHTDRLRVGAGLRRRDRRHSRCARAEPARRLFCAVAARSPVPFPPSGTRAAVRRQRC